jgi:hypothetical protein
VIDPGLSPNNLPNDMSLKFKDVDAGSLTVGNFNGWVKLTSGSFYYPARAYNADVEASYIVYRTGKFDTRYMETLYANNDFFANSLTTDVDNVVGSNITIGDVLNGSV